MRQLSRWIGAVVVTDALYFSSHSVAFFHSTYCRKRWKNKSNSNIARDERPSKDYVRYSTRLKRADTKKALKDLLNGGSLCSPFDHDNSRRGSEKLHLDVDKESSCEGKKKYFSRHAKKADYNRRRVRRKGPFNDFDDNEIQVKFEKCWTSWSFHLHGDASSQSSKWGYTRHQVSDTSSESEYDDDSSIAGMSSAREILGLPAAGALRIQDVKNAFRTSALRWHPDKHQGPSQAEAEEKFKLCVSAYKSLCNALSPS